MARRKPWYKALFERDYFDYFYVGGPRGIFSDEERARQAEAQVDFIVQALEPPEGARILDLGCGWGRHAVRLAQRGYRVTGLDLSAYHLRLAKSAARKAGVEVEWLHGDMREIPGPRGRYDAVINCFTTFGYFEDEVEDQRVLDGVARALRPGGRFFVDLINQPGLMRRFQERDWQQRADGSFTLEYRRFDVHTGRSEADWYFFGPNGERRHQFHSVRLYTFPELAAMLSRAGMTVRRTWGNFDDSELGLHSPRMIVLAEKS